MDTLIVIGIGLSVVTGLCAVVYEMAEARGRHPWGWTLAAFIGLAFAIVGWAVVAAALMLIGPTRENAWAARHEHAVAAHSRG